MTYSYLPAARPNFKPHPKFPDSSVGKESACKNLPAMQETPVWFLGQEDLLEKG